MIIIHNVIKILQISSIIFCYLYKIFNFLWFTNFFIIIVEINDLCPNTIKNYVSLKPTASNFNLLKSIFSKVRICKKIKSHNQFLFIINYSFSYQIII